MKRVTFLEIRKKYKEAGGVISRAFVLTMKTVVFKIYAIMKIFNLTSSDIILCNS